jgi:putative hemolysin
MNLEHEFTYVATLTANIKGFSAFPGSRLGIGLEGARYHQNQLLQALGRAGMSTLWNVASVDEATRSRLQRDVNEFHWHLRAFFWELVAEFDMLLVVVNHSEALGIAEEKVSWDEVARQAV